MKKPICLFLSISLIFINFSFAQSQEKSKEIGMKSEVKNVEKKELKIKPIVKVKEKKPTWRAQVVQAPKKRRKALIPIIIGIVVLGVVGYLLLKKSDEEAGITYQGTVSDPVGDASQVAEGLTHDLVSAKIEISGQDAIFEVHYAPWTFDELLTRALFLLDTDQNPSTGHPGTRSSGTVDADNIGVEYLLFLGPKGSDYGAIVSEHTGGVNNFNQIGTYSVTKLFDGFRVSIPLSGLGGDEGRMNFKVNSSGQISVNNSGSFGVADSMPDVGLPAGEVK